MKKTFITRIFVTMLLFIGSMTASAECFGVWVSDADKTTNIRNNPKGTIIGSLNNSLGTWCMLISEIRDGWCRIEIETLNVAEDSEVSVPQFKVSRTGYWIHNSMVAFSGRGDSHVTLRSEPSSRGKVIYSKDDTMVHPVELRGEWVKVKTFDGKYTGWMKIEDICSNPLTNCC